MNKIDEYKSKMQWDIWEDIMLIKQRIPPDETEKINAIRNAILDKCASDGGEKGSTGVEQRSGELSDDSVIGQISKCKR